MKSDHVMKSKVYRILDYILRLIILNALIVIPSFSFFIIYSIFDKSGNSPLVYLTFIPTLLYLFPSIVATTDVIRQYENNETNTIFKDFFLSFKKYYISSILLSIVIYILVFLFANSLIFFFNNATHGLVYLIGLFLSVSFSIIFIIITIQIPLVLTYFNQLGFINTLKLSFIIGFKYLKINLLGFIIILVTITIGLLNNFVMAFIGFSLPIYLIIKITFKHYIKIYRKINE